MPAQKYEPRPCPKGQGIRAGFVGEESAPPTQKPFAAFIPRSDLSRRVFRRRSDKNAITSILFFGTSGFAVPVLEALIRNGYALAGVVTNQDEPAGRKRVLTPPPVKVCAARHGIPVFQPEKLNPENFAREIPAANLFVVAAYGKIIPQAILDIPKYGALNIHPSLLPRWRGPSPIQHTILAGDPKTGVSIIKIDAQMDHGPIVAQTSIKYPVSSIQYQELHDRLANLGADLLIRIVPKWIAGAITPTPQDDTKATYCKLLTKNDGRIDWIKPAEDIERAIRAYRPWPGTWTIWHAPERDLRIRIEEADWITDEIPGAAPGFVWQNEKRPLCAQSGRGSLAIQKLQSEGGRHPMDAASFLRGRPSFIGAALS